MNSVIRALAIVGGATLVWLARDNYLRTRELLNAWDDLARQARDAFTIPADLPGHTHARYPWECPPGCWQRASWDAYERELHRARGIG
jgi:hypothetical protein